MALSAFLDKSRPPSAPALAASLGPSLPQWRELRRRVALQAPGIVEEWGYTSQATGWGLRLKLGKRVILYLTPGTGAFLASTALGEKPIARARRAGFSRRLDELLTQAPTYAEGRGVRLTVRGPADVTLASQIVALKLST